MIKPTQPQLVTRRDLKDAEKNIIHELTVRVGAIAVAVAGVIIGIIEITK